MEKTKDALKSGIITKDLTIEERNRAKLEALLKQEEKIVNSPRIYLQPFANIQLLNLGEKISKLDSQRKAPDRDDYFAGLFVEASRASIYITPLIYTGMEIYKRFQ